MRFLRLHHCSRLDIVHTPLLSLLLDWSKRARQDAASQEDVSLPFAIAMLEELGKLLPEAALHTSLPRRTTAFLWWSWSLWRYPFVTRFTIPCYFCVFCTWMCLYGTFGGEKDGEIWCDYLGERHGSVEGENYRPASHCQCSFFICDSDMRALAMWHPSILVPYSTIIKSPSKLFGSLLLCDILRLCADIPHSATSDLEPD
ncbi:hypothetical protein IQ07DRAFT_276422 [Pyrenochaeta sp. DS3sAY3a]|nr:hypothetical protein IQ07DRAFT_276422 [Pyrenochaeta sp. DS3sAY3a]